MSIWDRLRGVSKTRGRRGEALRLEERGDFEQAAELYMRARFGDEACRVLLLAADVSSDLRGRLALIERAARAAQSDAAKLEAERRRARLRFDLVRTHGTLARGELALAATELSRVGLHELAAEAHSLLGDRGGELDQLAQAGAIDTLEDKLREDAALDRARRELSASLRRIDDLAAGGERRAAIQLAEESAAKWGDDRALEKARVLRARLLLSPVFSVAFGGRQRHLALGNPVSVGRGEATIVIASRSVSRVHLLVYREGDQVFARDAGTSNGTFLGAARLTSPLAILGPTHVRLGPEVSCEITPSAKRGGVLISVAGRSCEAPLADLDFEGWQVTYRDGCAQLIASSRPAYLGQLETSKIVDLCAGDAFSAVRGGEPTLTVVADGDRR